MHFLRLHDPDIVPPLLIVTDRNESLPRDNPESVFDFADGLSPQRLASRSQRSVHWRMIPSMNPVRRGGKE